MTERTSNEKLAYEKPELRVIELAAEEVMATGCKTLTGKSLGVSSLPCAANQCVLQHGS